MTYEKPAAETTAHGPQVRTVTEALLDGNGVEQLLARLQAPETVRTEFLDTRACPTGARSETTRDWGGTCILPGTSGDLGQEVTLTITWFDHDGNVCDTKTKTWCSRGTGERDS